MKRIIQSMIPVLALLAVMMTGTFVLLPGGCKKEIMAPFVSTAEASHPTENSFTCGGNVTSDGGDMVTGRGICWSTMKDPTLADNRTFDGTGTGIFTSVAASLAPNTVYYVRAYATNDAGTAYGINVEAVTSPVWSGTVKDIDSTTYHTIVIGSQEWMGENLRTTRLNDGTPIEWLTGPNTWALADYAAYCYNENNKPLYAGTYGALYNGYAALSGKLCPKGWHVPSDIEWQHLIDRLGGSKSAAAKLKEPGSVHWLTSHPVSTNESCFTALPGGLLVSHSMPGGGCYGEGYDIPFIIPGYIGAWWTSTSQIPDSLVFSEIMAADSGSVSSHSRDITDGLSVRCIKN